MSGIDQKDLRALDTGLVLDDGRLVIGHGDTAHRLHRRGWVEELEKLRTSNHRGIHGKFPNDLSIKRSYSEVQGRACLEGHEPVVPNRLHLGILTQSTSPRFS